MYLDRGGKPTMRSDEQFLRSQCSSAVVERSALQQRVGYSCGACEFRTRLRWYCFGRATNNSACCGVL